MNKGDIKRMLHGARFMVTPSAPFAKLTTQGAGVVAPRSESARAISVAGEAPYHAMRRFLFKSCFRQALAWKETMENRSIVLERLPDAAGHGAIRVETDQKIETYSDGDRVRLMDTGTQRVYSITFESLDGVSKLQWRDKGLTQPGAFTGAVTQDVLDLLVSVKARIRRIPAAPEAEPAPRQAEPHRAQPDEDGEAQ